jgi:hypothetical protein
VVEVQGVPVSGLSPATAVRLVQVATAVGPVVTGEHDDVFLQPFAGVGPPTVHVATGTFVESMGVQVTVMKFGDVPAVVIAVRAPPKLPDTGQVAGSTTVGPLVLTEQVVDVQGVPVVGLLAAVASTGVQVAANEVVVIGVGQVTVIQLFPAFAVCGVHDARGSLVKTFGPAKLQVIVVQLLTAAATWPPGQLPVPA